jgi:hypothetical protein
MRGMLSGWVAAMALGAVAAAPELGGRTVCGYQGWFACPGDGSERGWVHWARGEAMAPGRASVDLWPDVSGLAPEDRFDTGFRHPDGRVAQVFSSHRATTVDVHFRWMREHGIDGVFVQRFANGLRDPKVKRFNDTVFAHCRAAARAHGRVLAVMYDLSGLKSGDLRRVSADWREIRGSAADPGYLHHAGRPLVAVWGVGFADGRAYDLAECRALVDELKAEQASVLLGVPAYWRSGRRDALPDPALPELCARADVLSPWTVGRYRDDATLAAYAGVLTGDVAWCRARGIAYLPVVFPGFSWHNLKGDPPDAIPRRGGRFLWSQFAGLREAGLDAAYVAMFDEVDEATAILPCVSDPPAQEGSRFIGCEGLPGDHYLWLTGQARRLLRGEREPDFPAR